MHAIQKHRWRQAYKLSVPSIQHVCAFQDWSIEQALDQRPLVNIDGQNSIGSD